MFRGAFPFHLDTVFYRYYIVITCGKTSEQFCRGMDKISEHVLVISTERKHPMTKLQIG